MDAGCAQCDYTGQSVTRVETVPYQRKDGTKMTAHRTYVQPCPHCERGQALRRARHAKFGMYGGEAA